MIHLKHCSVTGNLSNNLVEFILLFTVCIEIRSISMETLSYYVTDRLHEVLHGLHEILHALGIENV